MIPRLVRSRIAAAAAVVALPVLLASCANSVGPEEREGRELAAAKAAWAAQHLDSYTLVVRPVCYCGTASIRATVVNGAVTSRTFVETGTPVPDVQFGSVETVDAMLATLERAFEEDAAEVEADYDSRGIPQHASIDWYANAIDDEFGWVVVELTPAP